MKAMKEKIEQLKKEKNAVILAHYYVPKEVQEVADFVGDSYYLAKKARETEAEIIVFAGVSFMGESAKILNPTKKVLLPDAEADCAMAHMASAKKVQEMREKYEDLAVVCYINSTAALKTVSDVCVTSSNAVKIVKALPNKNIFFIPDENLGRHIAEKLPDKHFIFNDGFCHVHKSIHKEDILKAKEVHPEAMVLAHPECTPDTLSVADFIGSTSQIIDYATSSEKTSFIICTEMGIFYELMQKNPEKKFYSVGHRQFCPNMKKVNLENVLESLEKMAPEIELDEELRESARKPLKRMLELAAN